MKKNNLIILIVMMISLCACQSKSSNSLVNQPTKLEFSTDATIEETILYDEHDVTITATELTYNAYYAEVGLLIENNSDLNLSFISGSIGYNCNSVNGYMVTNAYLNEDVDSHEQMNETIQFSLDELKMFGIYEISDIEIGFDIHDEEYNHYYTEPCSIKTSVYKNYDYQKNIYQKAMNTKSIENEFNLHIDNYQEKIIYQELDFSILSVGLITNQADEKIVLLEVENNSDEMYYTGFSSVQMNEFVVQGSNSSFGRIYPSKKQIIGFNLSKMISQSYWEMLGIENIHEFSFSFVLFNEDYQPVTKSKEVVITFDNQDNFINDTGEEVYNNKNIRIIYKGIIEDDYSDDLHLILLIENNYKEELYFDVEDDTLFVNDCLVDEISYSSLITSSKYGILDIELQSSSLEENQIEKINQIKLKLDIHNKNYKKIDKPNITIINE